MTQASTPWREYEKRSHNVHFFKFTFFDFTRKKKQSFFETTHIMGNKEKKATIKFQKNKLKAVVKKRKENNKFKKQVNKRQSRRGAPVDPRKGKVYAYLK